MAPKGASQRLSAVDKAERRNSAIVQALRGALYARPRAEDDSTVPPEHRGGGGRVLYGRRVASAAAAFDLLDAEQSGELGLPQLHAALVRFGLAGLDEGILSLCLPILVCMQNPYKKNKSQ